MTVWPALVTASSLLPDGFFFSKSAAASDMAAQSGSVLARSR